MGASDYNKEDSVAFGKAVGNLISAIRKDGIGADDFGALIRTVSAAGQVVNEMKDVPEAATEHVLGAAADTLGDDALERALADEQGTAL